MISSSILALTAAALPPRRGHGGECGEMDFGV